MEGFSMSSIRESAVDLFTSDEHAVLAQWFGVEPPNCAKDIVMEDAAKRLGFVKEPGHYRRIDAAAAFIVVESVEKRLPQWAAVREDSVILARKHRDETTVPDRTVLLQPRHLFTINWADSGPGFSWPVAYYVTWLPYYDRFVVTASADCPDAFGYCDFALDAFGIDTPLKESAKKIICEDWTGQNLEWEQQRWVYLFNTGLISEPEANAWADEVWPGEPDEEEIDDEDAAVDVAEPEKPSSKPQTKPTLPPSSEAQLEERERLVAEIKKHHPGAITEGIIKHLEAWGE
jgi:hypothetical protein